MKFHAFIRSVTIQLKIGHKGLDVVLDEAKGAGFNVAEIVTDKDSSVKSIYLKHYPEGRVGPDK